MLVMFGAPTALLITGLLHVVAAGDHNLYTAVGDQAPVWIGVHTVQLLLILLMAVASPVVHRGMARGCPVGSPANVTVRVW